MAISDNSQFNVKAVVDLRAATPADLGLLLHWDEQPHIITCKGGDVEQAPADDWGWEVELQRDPDWREQLIAEIEGSVRPLK